MAWALTDHDISYRYLATAKQNSMKFRFKFETVTIVRKKKRRFKYNANDVARTEKTPPSSTTILFTYFLHTITKHFGPSLDL